MRKTNPGGLVYSTDSGRMCPTCRRPFTACVCTLVRQQAAATPRGDGIARVGRESKGRGGKTVTLVRGLPVDAATLGAIAQRLKTACGSGGTVKDGVIEVQGDHVERVMQWLAQQGHQTKRTGG